MKVEEGGREMSNTSSSRSSGINSCNGDEEGESVPIPPRRGSSRKSQVFKRFLSHGEAGAATSANGNGAGMSNNNENNKANLTTHPSLDKDNEIDSIVQRKNFLNSVASYQHIDDYVFPQMSSGDGGVSSTLVLLDANGYSTGGNGSDEASNENGVSSPETGLPPFVAVIPTLSSVSRQSLKHLSASAPVMQTALRSMGSDSEFTLAPSSSKSRQKKFHRHFKTVAPDEKVLEYYSCALVGDILLQGYLYITENNFAFYSNVFGYVTKLLIPVCSVVRITKERTAKIIPNAVGICTRAEKHVFASLLSRDTTYKLMCKVWNYSIDQEAKEVLKITTKLKEEDKGSGDLSVPDESSAESGSGNDSAIEPSSPITIGKLVHVGKVLGGALPGSPTTGRSGSLGPQGSLKGLASALHHHPISSSIGGTPTIPATSTAYARIPHRTSIVQANAAKLSTISNKKSLQGEAKSRGPSLILLATALLVILFLSAALLLNRISNLQDKLSMKPTFRDSDQFYQELLSWQNKLHTSSADEIHQYINMNLQQIIRVRQSLEALSLLFMSGQTAETPKISETAYKPRDKV